MKAIFKHIGVVLFIGLLLIKVSSFHVYEHHDARDGDENQCELCLLTIASQQGKTLTVTLDFLQQKFIPTTLQSKIFISEFQVSTGLLGTDLFSRPPPVLYS